jgi:uncharacterized protein involved in exopolysaccharide biosynthesis
LNTEEKEYREIAKSSETAIQMDQDGLGQSPDQKREVQDDEIDLVELVRKFWAEKKIVFILMPVFFLLGVLVAVVSPVEYTAETTLLPQSGSSSAASLGSGLLQQFGLGGLGGAGAMGSSSGLSVNLYPDVTHSTPFLIKLIEQEFYFSDMDTTVSLFTYFSEIKEPTFTDHVKKYTLGVPKMLVSFPLQLFTKKEGEPTPTSDKDKTYSSLSSNLLSQDSLKRDELEMFKPVRTTAEQLKVINELKDRISTSIETNGTLSVSAKMPDPEVAAKVTEMAVVFLTNYIKEYKVDKAREDLEFIQAQYEEKEARYNQAQRRLATLRDRNSNIATESGRIELERAQTEFNLAFSLYQGIAQQLEQAKIKLQEETPLFKVLEPVQVPLTKSEPNQELIVILFTFGGVFVGFGIIFFKVIYQQLKQSFS